MDTVVIVNVHKVRQYPELCTSPLINRITTTGRKTPCISQKNIHCFINQYTTFKNCFQYWYLYRSWYFLRHALIYLTLCSDKLATNIDWRRSDGKLEINMKYCEEPHPVVGMPLSVLSEKTSYMWLHWYTSTWHCGSQRVSVDHGDSWAENRLMCRRNIYGRA